MPPPVIPPTRDYADEEIVVAAGGAKGSACPDYSLLTFETLNRLIDRLQLGADRYGRDNWKQDIANPKYVKSRLNHMIKHCYILMAKIDGKMPPDNDDDAAALFWGGMFAVEGIAALEAAGMVIVVPGEPAHPVLPGMTPQ